MKKTKKTLPCNQIVNVLKPNTKIASHHPPHKKNTCCMCYVLCCNFFDLLAKKKVRIPVWTNKKKKLTKKKKKLVDRFGCLLCAYNVIVCQSCVCALCYIFRARIDYLAQRGTARRKNKSQGKISMPHFLIGSVEAYASSSDPLSFRKIPKSASTVCCFKAFLDFSSIFFLNWE